MSAPRRDAADQRRSPRTRRHLSTRRRLLHSARVATVLAAALLVHLEHRRHPGGERGIESPFFPLELVQKFFPTAARLTAFDPLRAGRTVVDAGGLPLGVVVQTSPQSDNIVGFSGPTNTLVALDVEDRVVGIDVLSSGDTEDHLQQVLNDEHFLRSFNGLSWGAVLRRREVDAVSGATLTSLSIAEGVLARLGGERPSLRFPDPLELLDALPLFPDARSIAPTPGRASLWSVQDGEGQHLGALLRTSPAADNIVGYQGPTDSLVAVGTNNRVLAVSLKASYDNEPYVRYVREDGHFSAVFAGMSLGQLAQLDLDAAEVDGVSGATMTSQAMAEGLVKAAAEFARREAVRERAGLSLTPRDLATAAVVLVGLFVAFTRLGKRRALRLGFQVLVVAYLGFVSGDMVSQALLVGWAQNGAPWRMAAGLVLLTATAFLVPVTTRRQPYCHQLCPHGAVQQLIRNRLPWRFVVPMRLGRLLSLLPALLLGWVLFVAMCRLPFSLVDIEPFDAYLLGIAGWATITVAVVGLAASLFVPMAYCRFGCPTGTLLNYLRYNSRSDRLTRRDALALAALALAGLLYFLG